MDKRTELIHGESIQTPFAAASSTPLYLASTFAQNDPEIFGNYDYTRSGNPTREVLEKKLARLENGSDGFAFASGMATICSVLLLFQPGDHLIVSEDSYGGTFRALTKLFSRWGLAVSFVDTADPVQVEAAVTEKTKGLFIETPSNPLLKITDLAAMGKIAKEHNLLSIIDGTFSTPVNQTPLDFGFDIVIHSATKFLSGHSDVLAGVAVTRTPKWGKRLKFIQNTFGAVLGVQDSWLLLRSLKTLGVRMETAQKSAEIIAREILYFPGVKKVHHPSLEEHPGREIHFRQAKGGGAVLSFELKNKEFAMAFMKSIELPLLAVSLGGVESILTYPATMSHAAIPENIRKARGITDALVRLSVGLEAPEDLLRDIKQALKKAAFLQGKK